MFKQIEALSSEKHQDLRYTKTNNFSFASNINLVQLSHSEIKPASRFYPIVFPQHQPQIPHAVLSFTPQKNNYLNEDGKWKVPYVPFIVRSYPFLMLKSQNDATKNVLCIDAQADHFKEEFGDILFTADEKPNDFTSSLLNNLNIYTQEIETTKKIFEDLISKEVIVEKKISVQIDDKTEVVGGFKVIDIEKIFTLEDKEIAELVKKGIMPLIYDHLSSISSLKLLSA